MKNITFFRFLIIVSVTMLLSLSAKATHYLGSEITYDSLGNNQYQIDLTLYTDCSGVSAPTSITIDVTSTCTGTTAIALNYDNLFSGEVQLGCPGTTTTCNGGMAFGVMKSHYSAVVTLNPCSDWVISYGTCCRNVSPINLLNPNAQGHYIEATLDNSSGLQNQSPVILHPEPIFYNCAGDTLYSSTAAYESDNDSLVYSLIPCYASQNQPVNYNTGFSATTPFLNGSISIDPTTGLIKAYSPTAQTASICVKIEEYRNGTKISEVMRDFQMSFGNCTNQVPTVNTINGLPASSGTIFNVSVGTSLTLDYNIFDPEVQQGSQTLTVSNQTGSFSLSPTGNSNYSGTFTPTIADVGQLNYTIKMIDDNCPYRGISYHSIIINVTNTPFIDAIDDYFTAYQGQQISGNIVINDISNGAKVVNSQAVVNPSNGSIVIAPNGTFAYFSNPNFSGVDSFVYTVCNGSVCDDATVYLNILPIYTIEDTIVLGETYAGFYCFTDSAQYATDTLSNAILWTIDDSCFSIHGEFLGTDTAILYSNNEMVIFNITVENGVWPGDTDDDALVNNFDLLNIGLAYNSVGVPRNPASILWNGYLADDWATSLPSGLNNKHADTDGNGVINADDTLAIVQSWGLSYTKNGGSTGAPLFVQVDSMSIVNDSIGYLPIMLGDIQNPVSNIYGLAFTITYSSGLVKDSSVMVHFEPSWLGTPNVDIISIEKDFYNNELVEVAVTRTDGMNINGSGQIGRMCFTIQDDIIRGVDSTFYFGINTVKAISNDGSIVDISGENREIDLAKIVAIANNTQTVDLSNKIRIYPNPTSDWLTIDTKDLEIENIQIFDVTGRKVLEKNQLNNRNQLNINNLEHGLYIINIETNKGRINQKLIKR